MRKILQITFLIICFFSTNSFAQPIIQSGTTGIRNEKSAVEKARDEDEARKQSEAQKEPLIAPQQTPNEKRVEDKKKEGFLSSIVDSMVKLKKDTTSLMFSDEEAGKIEEAFDAFKNNKPFLTTPSTSVEKVAAPEENSKSYIYLGSILYKSPNVWSAWINDQKISAEDNKIGNELYIKSINQDKASIVWTMSISKWKILTNNKSDERAPINRNNQVEINFTLSFNQTYMLNGERIVEGKVSSSPVTIPNKI